ncbi:MAG: hypothetical protein QM627_07530 [Luteolibacter sp.]
MVDPTPTHSYSVRGGARIGWVNYSWPLASLDVDASRLTISTTFLGLFETGNYSFRSDQITRIQKFRWLPVFGEGIRIRHTVTGYPKKILFWCRSSAVLPGIAATGFPTTANGAIATELLQAPDFPLRIWLVAIVVLLWAIAFTAIFLTDDFQRKPKSSDVVPQSANSEKQ